jgi:hypothetical protein
MRNKRGMRNTGVTSGTRQLRIHDNVPAIVRSRAIGLAVQRSVCVSDARGRGFGPIRRVRCIADAGAVSATAPAQIWRVGFYVCQEEQGGMKGS